MKYGHEAEIIISLYKLYGNQCVNYLKGFFAFVIIDLTKDNIFAAVDRFSIKPLYYVNDIQKKLNIFTSDYSVLIKNNLIKDDLNIPKIIDYLSLAREFNDSTIYNKIKKIPASTYLNMRHSKIIYKKYWSPFKNKIHFKNKCMILNSKIDDNWTIRNHENKVILYSNDLESMSKTFSIKFDRYSKVDKIIVSNKSGSLMKSRIYKK